MSALSGPRSDDGGETGTGARRDETERGRATEGADTTGGELRAVADILARHILLTPRLCACGEKEPFSDGLHDSAWHARHLAPFFRDLIAERDTLAAQVQAVEEFCDSVDEVDAPAWVGYIRRALGTPTTGGGGVNEEGTVTVVREQGPNGRDFIRVTRADPHVRISTDLLEMIQAGDVPSVEADEDKVRFIDSDGQTITYRLSDLDDTGRARWMEKL